MQLKHTYARVCMRYNLQKKRIYIYIYIYIYVHRQSKIFFIDPRRVIFQHVPRSAPARFEIAPRFIDLTLTREKTSALGT